MNTKNSIAAYIDLLLDYDIPIESVKFGTTVDRLRHASARGANLPPGAWLDFLCGTVPSETIALGFMEIYSLEHIERDHTDGEPSCYSIDHGFYTFAYGGGGVLAFDTSDSRVYLLPPGNIDEETVQLYDGYDSREVAISRESIIGAATATWDINPPLI